MSNASKFVRGEISLHINGVAFGCDSGVVDVIPLNLYADDCADDRAVAEGLLPEYDWLRDSGGTGLLMADCDQEEVYHKLIALGAIEGEFVDIE